MSRSIETAAGGSLAADPRPAFGGHIFMRDRRRLVETAQMLPIEPIGQSRQVAFGQGPECYCLSHFGSPHRLVNLGRQYSRLQRG